MTFMTGRDVARAAEQLGLEPPAAGAGLSANAALFDTALASSQFLVDSINLNSSVRRLIYTSSITSMMPALLADYNANPIMDERREPNGVDGTSYGATKRATEHFFSYQAACSGGHWSVAMGNPSDIVGPVLSPHQASETWQGQIGQILAGFATGSVVGSNPELSGRPWLFVDVRDVAEAEIQLVMILVEGGQLGSSRTWGRNFQLSSNDSSLEPRCAAACG